YPAWWASRLLPLEALQYEGGAGSRTRGQGLGIRRFLASLGMTAPWSPIRNPHPRVLTGAIRNPQSAIRNLPSSLRSLWRRRTRTALTLLGIGVGIAAIVALGGITRGMLTWFTVMLTGNQADLRAVQADTSDAYYSVIDERVGSRIAARPDVESVAGMIYVIAGTEKMPLLMGFGYHPREFGIRRFRIVAGQPLAARRQVIVGRQAAQKLELEVGDTLRLLESNFHVVGFYETGVPYEDNGFVMGLQEGQALSGRPHQVMIYLIKARDPRQAARIQDELEVAFPDLAVSLASNAAESMPDMQRMDQYVGAISVLAVFVGGIGMLNTMLMSVLERTREIGVLRALGWRRRRVLGMVLREALLLGLVGGACGILLGVGLAWAASQIPGSAGAIDPHYEVGLFVRALVVASVIGAIGGLYPAWRATRMRPVEALRYE
ncbi:MAG TPA: ABC transporter permease, partial [Anaerolineae bacterium]|nr:ABC transporter permease [Anaerolineae bacterium]